MCGIAGLIQLSGNLEPEYRSRFVRALDSIDHRGPDSHGDFSDQRVWLGHTRLSILDLSDAGRQPMQIANGRYVLTYNGEVYNFRELAKSAGLDNLRSGSDTEVVLRLFAKEGVSAFKRLNGMFAFALYDKQQEKIWLVRDRLGIKPLYVRTDNQRLAFGSEIKAIGALLGDQNRCDLSALHEWLYYGNPLGGRTLFEGIHQLLPGHYLEIDLSNSRVVDKTYWSLEEQYRQPVESSTNKRHIIQHTSKLLEQAVRRQLVSDVPVGLFLSGGIDSSAIAAFASRHYEGRLATYSAGFDFAPDGGELPRAKMLAKKYGTDHHEIHIAGGDVGDLVEKMVAHHDMPFADAANIPLYLMASQISSHTKVVLQGDGGDELFGGYRRYSTTKWHPVLNPVARLVRVMHSLSPKSAMHYRIQRYLSAFAGQDLGTTMALLLTPETMDSNPLKIFNPQLAQRIAVSCDPFGHYRRMQAKFSDADISNQMSLIDLSIILPDTYLEKVDRSTMAASLEVRVPFLDHDLVDYVVALPGSTKVSLGRKKWLLKEALRGIVPDEVLFTPKRGFGVPYGKWLQTSLKPMFFDQLASFERNHPDVLNQEHIKHLFERSSLGQRNHWALLWKTLNFVIWANTMQLDFAHST